MIRNSSTEFGSFSKATHWLVAAITFFLIIIGIYMGDLPQVTEDEKQFVLKLHTIHKSVGLVVILLVILRLIWHMVISPNPQLPAVIVDKERTLIRGVKKLLTAMMILLPLNGYLMSNANRHKIEFFGLFELPTLIARSESLHALLHAVHMIGGWLMLITILAHIAIVFKFWLEDEGTEKDILQRML